MRALFKAATRIPVRRAVGQALCCAACCICLSLLLTLVRRHSMYIVAVLQCMRCRGRGKMLVCFLTVSLLSGVPTFATSECDGTAAGMSQQVAQTAAGVATATVACVGACLSAAAPGQPCSASEQQPQQGQQQQGRTQRL